MSFLILFGLTVAIVVVLSVNTHVQASRMARLDWDDLVAQIKPVPFAGVSAVALDYLQPRKGQMRIETDELWTLIGGYDGIRRMYDNSAILLALAAYTQRWNPGESVIVVERMRRDGVLLRRTTQRLLLRYMFGAAQTRGPFSMQEATSAYYLMRERLLALYETSHAGRYAQLAAAL